MLTPFVDPAVWCLFQSVVSLGLILSIHSDRIRALILGSGEETVSAGHRVRHTRGHVPALDVARVDEWKGQLIDPIGRTLNPSTLLPIISTPPKPILIADAARDDGEVTPAGDADALPLLTLAPPSLASRSTAHRFMPTGFVHLDAFHPIAEGLRIGMMGAKRTGKTATAAAVLGSFAQQQQKQAVAVVDAAADADSTSDLLPSPLHFIYVSIGQSRADVRNLVDRLSRNGSLAQSTVVVASHESGMGLQYLAPFMGQTIADYYRTIGESSVIVFDDLSAHGQVLTTINRIYGSPLLAPNFVHARLLERSAPLQSGASTTALVLVETHRTDRTLDVNENLSGFVDHAIWLDAGLASAGAFPAINVASVLGRPAARYRPHVLRAVTNALSAQVLQSDRANNTARWANEFGLVQEEDDRPLHEFKDKCQIMLSQRLDDPLYTVAEQMLLLYALQQDAQMLARVSVENIAQFHRELMHVIRHGNDGANADDHAAMMAELESEVVRRLLEDGNSTEGAESSSTLMLRTDTESGESDPSSPATSLDLVAAKPSAESHVWPRVEAMLDRFQQEFIDKYER